jgi:hypothetical protein
MSSIHRASDIHSQLSDTIQPQANLDLGSLEFHQSNPDREKSLYASLDNSHHYRDLPSHCERGQTSLSHSDCHKNRKIRLRRHFLPTIFVLVTLGGLLAWRCHRAAWKVDLMRRDRVDRQFALLTHVLFNPQLIIAAISIVDPSRNPRLFGIVVLASICALLIIGTAFYEWCCRSSRTKERSNPKVKVNSQMTVVDCQ